MMKSRQVVFCAALALAAMAVQAQVPPVPAPDQLALLKSDNVVADGAAGLADLGVTAVAAEPIIPTYLYRYRKGGQYADLAPPAALQA